MALDYIKPIGTKSTVDRIVDEMMDAIISRHWKPGSKIPTEIELVEAFNVGRNSVREAVRVLVTLGMLEIRRPDGTFVADKFSEKMLDPLIYSLALEHDMSASLLELRSVFDTDCMELAIKNARTEDFEAIQKACDSFVELLEDPDSTSEMLLDADIRFHDEVCKATHNALFQRIHHVITRLSRQSRIKTIDYITEHNERDFLIQTHQKETQMILERSSEHVSETIADSFKYWRINIQLEDTNSIDI